MRDRSLQLLASLLLWTFVGGVLGLAAARPAPPSAGHAQRHASQPLALTPARPATLAPVALAPSLDHTTLPALALAARGWAPARAPSVRATLGPQPPLTPSTPVYLRQLVLLL